MGSDSPALSGNRLLARLTPRDLEPLLPHLKSVSLEFSKVLYDAQQPIDAAYFPNSGILSAVAIMDDGDGIEVATIGKEGLMGLPAFVEPELSPYRIIVQGAGQAYRIPLDAFKEELNRNAPLRDVVNRYHAAFLYQVSQCVACNGLHSVERRLCRWLLMSHDRLGVEELPLTHEFLALMLGTRRASVTEVLQPLQQRGLLKSTRGKITIVDRRGVEASSCECYQSVRREYDRLLGGGGAGDAAR